MSTTTNTTSDSAPSVRPNHHPPKLPSRPRKLPKLSTTPTRPLSSPGEISAAISHLREADPLLSSVIGQHPPPSFDSFQPPFLSLTKSIIFQQLSFKAASSIFSRFVSLCGGDDSSVVPSSVLLLSPSQLRLIGLSSRKSSYLLDLARKFHSGILSDPLILSLDDKSLFTLLTMVNGLGSWSVHMFMIFSLHRPDVLPVHDLHVRKGVQLLYGLDHLPRPSQMDLLCDKWRPFRSVGAWYMWRLVESTTSSPSLSIPPSLTSLPDPHSSSPQGQHPPSQFIDPTINSIINIGSNYAQLN